MRIALEASRFPARQEAYGEDLAYIHDSGFGDLARAAAGMIAERLRVRGIHTGLVVDLGCGSGIAARELTRAGYDVLGVDLSPAMIRLARRHAPRARFVVGSLLNVELPRCQAVVSLGECINYLFDQRNGPAARRRLFRRVYDALVPGGDFVFDFAEPGQPAGRRHVLERDWAVLSEAIEDRRRRTLERRITAFRKMGRLYRRTEEIHRLRLYPAAEVLRELRRIGFRARAMRRYGTLRLRPRCAAVFASRPEL